MPQKKGEKGYVLLRETLRRTKKAGIAKVVIRTRQHLAALVVVEDALVLNVLRFADEVIMPSAYEFPEKSLASYKITPKEIAISERLVKAMSAKWNPKKYTDDYRVALKKLIVKKGKGVPIPVKEITKPTTGKVIDFMELLQKSIAAKKRKPAKRVHHHARKKRA